MSHASPHAAGADLNLAVGGFCVPSYFHKAALTSVVVITSIDSFAGSFIGLEVRRGGAPVRGFINQAEPLTAFGRSIRMSGNLIFTAPTAAPASALFPDGRPRKWYAPRERAFFNPAAMRAAGFIRA